MIKKKHTKPDLGGERPQAASPEPDGKLGIFYGRMMTVADILCPNGHLWPSLGIHHHRFHEWGEEEEKEGKE